MRGPNSGGGTSEVPEVDASVVDAGFDTGVDAGDGGLVTFACSATPPSTNCLVYKNVPEAEAFNTLEPTCYQLPSACPSLSAGCCVTSSAGYILETCQYGTTAATVMASCTAMGQTYQALP